MAANVCNLESFFGGYISILPTGMITNLRKEKVSSSMASKCPVSSGMMADGKVSRIKLQANRAIHYFNAITIRSIFNFEIIIDSREVAKVARERSHVPLTQLPTLVDLR